MIGYVYCTNNKYNLRKCINILKARKIKYTIYDEYFVAERKIEDFKGNYYTKFIGTVNIKKFKNNIIESNVKEEKFLTNCGCYFYRKRKYFILNVENKNYYFKRFKKNDKIFNKFFIKKEKDFFEFNFNEVRNNQINMLNEDRSIFCADGYDIYKNRLENFISDYDEELEPIGLEHYEYMLEKKNFNIQFFFKYMTKNQTIILALWLLNLSNKAISLLLKSSSTYIFLEKQRIAKKIRNIINGVYYGHK
jgi:hypothetical protein